MPVDFTTLQRETLTAIVDTFVASVAREDDPDGFYATKGSDVGADLATEQYLRTHLPDEQLAGLLQLIDVAGLLEFKDQTQAAREEIVASCDLARRGAGDCRVESALGVVRLRPAWTTRPQSAVGRDGLPGSGPERARGLAKDIGGHHCSR
jgi:hypothetical protein